VPLIDYLSPARVLVACALCLLALAVAPTRAAAPTFQSLMDPTVFPEAQYGMRVESARLDGGRLAVVTTGAGFTLDLARGEITGSQRIGHPRPVARLRFGRPLSGVALTHTGPGFARATFSAPRATIRVNGDSLLMLQVHEPLTVSVERLIQPAWNASYHTNHLIADEWGAFGLYCSEARLDDHYDPFASTVARYRLPAGAVLWLGVCPPKPYDWSRSLKDNVVWHWSQETGYPADNVLRSWKGQGNIVLLQSEVMLWKDWNLAFVPRTPGEFERVRRTLHSLGMRFIVYTSPYYFLKGTPLESAAFNSFENFKSWPPGTPTGENIEPFMAEITRVMRDYQPDGLYYDGQYMDNPAALYALARRSRALVGEKGVLEWHSTMALGEAQCYLPQADAYVDFILRGEGKQGSYGSRDYLRFFVSGYNINNSIGVLCNNSGAGPTPELIRDVLAANARFHTLVAWLNKPATMDVLNTEYRARLTPGLRAKVERGFDAHQARVPEVLAARQKEMDTLAREPAWTRPVFSLRFDTMPPGEQRVSKQNPDALRVQDGTLRIHAHAHTFAHVAVPVRVKARGVVVRVRQGSDGGQAWGPGVLLRFANGVMARVNSRSDATLMSDVPGAQFHGRPCPNSGWVWLRMRWGSRWGVVEQSTDGKRYERVWTFDHGGAYNGETKELLVGKLSWDGEPTDHTEPGPIGDCEIGEAHVY
jgi:hypothetical protein